ncbi:hypothetical protein [Burkholderia pyrrocinia]|uniref:hypothetical protein n=1 Tax=Burkholderia pyrrocinia TaxID=60550 RepID=UPI000AA29E98|nr:hypothetical protein [Burkholderia pyrrocinia]
MDTTGRARSHDLRHRAILSAGPGRRRRTILVLLVVLIGYAAADLFWPLHRDLSRFDPIATGTLETKMWRAYYDRQHVALFLELAQTLRTQYHLPWLRSYVGAYYGASAAFTFKEGKERSDYEKALPALHTYFSLIRNTGNRDFDVSRTTALELEWWIVHRQRGRYPPGALGSACADAAASLYRVSAVATREHGQLRAQAMLLRDAREDAGSVTDADWATIESLLHRSYLSLGHAVSSTNAVAGAR